jgi:3-oxoacyl-[acyl-carrier-protein] synthase-3
VKAVLAMGMNRQLKRAGILGIGSYVPPRVLTNFDLEKMVDTSDEWIRTRTGISERHIADEASATSDLAVHAARSAMENAGVTESEIDAVIVATITPDMLFPSTACIVQSKLGLARCVAFDISAGCSGFIYALAVGNQFIASGLYEKILVIGADTLSKVINWQDRSTCVLFGDGAGAVVLGPAEDDDSGILSIYLGADGTGAEVLMVPAGGSLRPTTYDTIDNKLHYIHMNGNEVFKFAVKIQADAAMESLRGCGLDKKDIDWFIPHQANIRIIDAAARRLDIPSSKVVCNVDKYGNTSAASIPLALDEIVRNGKVKTGDILMMVGFGAGLTWGSSVVRWR